jgi:hypothetical protein
MCERSRLCGYFSECEPPYKSLPYAEDSFVIISSILRTDNIGRTYFVEAAQRGEENVVEALLSLISASRKETIL